jgi:hypothetical protein
VTVAASEVPLAGASGAPTSLLRGGSNAKGSTT